MKLLGQKVYFCDYYLISEVTWSVARGNGSVKALFGAEKRFRPKAFWKKSLLLKWTAGSPYFVSRAESMSNTEKEPIRLGLPTTTLLLDLKPRSRTRDRSCLTQNHGSCKEHNITAFFFPQKSRSSRPKNGYYGV